MANKAIDGWTMLARDLPPSVKSQMVPDPVPIMKRWEKNQILIAKKAAELSAACAAMEKDLTELSVLMKKFEPLMPKDDAKTFAILRAYLTQLHASFGQNHAGNLKVINRVLGVTVKM